MSPSTAPERSESVVTFRMRFNVSLKINFYGWFLKDEATQVKGMERTTTTLV